MSPEQIEEELTFTEVLIASLDPFSSDFAERAAELNRMKASLEAMMSNINSGSRPASQHSHQSNGQDLYQSPSHLYPRPSSNDRPGSNSNGGVTSPWSNPYLSNLSSHPQHNSQSTSDAQTTMQQPPFGSKRPRTNSNSFDSEANMRYTPEPRSASTSNFVPMSSLERARRAQQAEEAAVRRIRERQKEEERDAAYARQLAAQSGQSGFGSSSRPSNGGFQTTLNYDGRFERPPSLPKPERPTLPPISRLYSQPSQSSQTPVASSQYPSNPQRHQAADQSRQNYGQPRTLPWVKPEPGLTRDLVQRPRRPAASSHAGVIDLTGSDDEESMPQPRSRPQPSSSNPHGNSFMNASQIPGAWPSHPGSDLSSAGHGNSGWSNIMTPAMNHAPRPLLGNAMQELGNIVFGSIAPTFNLDSDGEDEDDDVIYSGSRHYGNYAGREDLYRSRYDALAAYDPLKSREEIQKLLENIRPDEDMPAHLRVQTPEDMSIRLHKYQEMGLTWLQNCEKGSNKGGILADDMGLGKTIQMLSLIVTRKSDDPRCKTTLIIAPVALMRQWKQEIQQKLKPGKFQLTVFTHHGAQKAKDFRQLQTYDVVLTTYGSIASELKRQEKYRIRKLHDPYALPTQSEKCVLLGEDAQWYRVVLDEAQCIKNRSTQTSKGTCMLNSVYRFCVTGTPMMNNVEELYSLIHFLRIKPYCQWEKFRLDFAQPLKSQNEDTKAKAMRMFQTVCKAIMLRRTKKSMFEGRPILVLPERTTEMDYPAFSEDEKGFYAALENQTQLEFNKYLRRGTVGTHYSAVLVLLLRLRQACCHPHLIKDFGVSAAADLTPDQMLDFAKALAPAVVARIKETKGNFECPVCYDVTPNPAIFIPCGHDTCSECFARIADPASAIQNGEEGGGARCPNCRATIDAKKLTDFASFKRVHMPELLTEADTAENEDDAENTDSDSDSGSEDEAADHDETDSLDGFIVNDDELDEDKDRKVKAEGKKRVKREDEDEDEHNDDDDDDDTEDDLDRPVQYEWFHERPETNGESATAAPSTSTSGIDSKKPKIKHDSSKKKKSKGKGKGKKMKKVKPHVTLAELKKLANRNIKARKTYLRRLRKNYVSSAKIDKTMDILNEVMAAPEGEKILIFSQWTSLLDLLEIPIEGAGFGYRRYDGSMSAKMRGDAVDDFRDTRKDVRIMLISLKAGNAGLNLNMASQVIILDPFWNPYIEEQAIDRAHRIGQTRPVTVRRVLIEGTVEDRIIALQEKKRALISEALDEKQGSALARLGVRELAYLFGVGAMPGN